MKRNRGGEQDLDHIMMAAVRGIDRASLEYPVKTGMIVCLDRAFSRKLNEILLEKAILFSGRGVVGIDMAGPAVNGFRYSEYAGLFRRARREGLGLTVHAGEDEGADSVTEVIRHLEPDRIGHGVRATEGRKAMELVEKTGTVLEVCPTSNLNTGVVKDVASMKKVFGAMKQNRMKFTLNTDGPEMLMTNLRGEIDFLLRNEILEKQDVVDANATAFDAAFTR